MRGSGTQDDPFIIETEQELIDHVNSLPYYECENCIGMIEYGCYCRAHNAIAPGGPSIHFKRET